MNQRYVIITFVTAFLAVSPGVVFADEIVISGNGSESTNTVNGNNKIDANATTRENSASGNNGEVNVQTGDVVIDASAANQLNNSQADAGCCARENNSAAVIGNGSETSNIVTVKTSTKNTGVVNQYANITNNIQGKAVTGNNTASNNSGNVSIKTGEIHIDTKIKNSPVNISKIKLANSSSGYSLSISGNGSNSQNEITFSDSFESTIFETNQADIYNNVLFDLISGGNKADDNSGDVLITTGSITAHIDIVNGPINVNDVTVTCCEEKNDDNPENPITPPSPPTPTPGKGGSSGGTGGSGGSSQGHSDSAGHVLPVTGGSFMFIAFLVSSIMLFLGSVLRLRSGRSPGFVK